MEERFDNARIMLCEDDENLGMLLREYLEAKGYTADLCVDGEEGYRTFQEKKYGAILRRVKGNKSQSATIYQIGRFTFDSKKQLLTIDGHQEKLTTKESDLLKLLASKSNELLQRDYALRAIWVDNNYFNARSMDVYITKLRKLLKADPNVELINVHGKGYKLVIPE